MGVMDMKTYNERIKENILKPTRYVSSGIWGIDQNNGGWCVGEMNIISAGSGVGKSLSAITSALLMCDMGKKVAYYSLENFEQMDRDRIDSICTCYGLDRDRVFNNLYYFNGDMYEEGFSATALNEWLSEDSVKLDAIFIDSFDYIRESSGQDSIQISFNNRKICQALLKFIRGLDVALIVTVQLNPEASHTSPDKVHCHSLVGGQQLTDKAAFIWAYLIDIKVNERLFVCLKSRTDKYVRGDAFNVGQANSSFAARINPSGQNIKSVYAR
jgi:archaellum biogenesis ATPase FlaH